MARYMIHAYLDVIARLLEVMGVLAIVAGSAIALFGAARSIVFPPPGDHNIYDAFRARLAKSILVGVEFLIAADIVGTVIIEPSLDSLGVLAVIVLIRTFLSFSLEVEIEGRWPWQRQRNRRDDD
ncbi:MAG: DUF1622 domain-containing protein [Rhodobacteraceae bacterium]|nr:DUF1622 domain-containing protein [Paracoccaceae bacterium]